MFAPVGLFSSIDIVLESTRYLIDGSFWQKLVTNDRTLSTLTSEGAE